MRVSDKVNPEDLMANKLVAYKVLTRKLVKNYPKKADVYEYNVGECFPQADTKERINLLKKKRLDPSYLM